MRCRVLGNVGVADYRLTSALAILSDIYPVIRVRGKLEILNEPSREADDGLTHLFWRAARVIVRERNELARLRSSAGLIRPRQMLVLACVEHLTWVDFDPMTWSADAHLDLDLTPTEYERLVLINRGEMCERATNLRHLADEQAPDVSDHVWKRLGGPVPVPFKIRALALQELARPETAEPGKPMEPSVPVRRARQWARDFAIAAHRPDGVGE